MSTRMTLDIDEELLARAQCALGSPSIEATVEEALRRAAEVTGEEFAARRKRQLEYLDSLGTHVDLDVLASDEMWR